MKIILNPSQYTFNPASNEVDFGSFNITTFEQERVLAVINTSFGSGVLLFATGTKMGNWTTPTNLRFLMTTTAMDPADVLCIIYDAPDLLQTIPFNIAAGTSTSWTVPSTQKWTVCISGHNPIACPGNAVIFTGVTIATPIEKGFFVWQWEDLRDGELEIIADAGGDGIQGFLARHPV